MRHDLGDKADRAAVFKATPSSAAGAFRAQVPARSSRSCPVLPACRDLSPSGRAELTIGMKALISRWLRLHWPGAGCRSAHGTGRVVRLHDHFSTGTRADLRVVCDFAELDAGSNLRDRLAPRALLAGDILDEEVALFRNGLDLIGQAVSRSEDWRGLQHGDPSRALPIRRHPRPWAGACHFRQPTRRPTTGRPTTI